MNKISVLWLGAGAAVGLLLTSHRSVLRRPWPGITALLAALVFAPYLAWQVRHGWPTIEFIRNAASLKWCGCGTGFRSERAAAATTVARDPRLTPHASQRPARRTSTKPLVSSRMAGQAPLV